MFYYTGFSPSNLLKQGQLAAYKGLQAMGAAGEKLRKTTLNVASTAKRVICQGAYAITHPKATTFHLTANSTALVINRFYPKLVPGQRVVQTLEETLGDNYQRIHGIFALYSLHHIRPSVVESVKTCNVEPVLEVITDDLSHLKEVTGTSVVDVTCHVSQPYLLDQLDSILRDELGAFYDPSLRECLNTYLSECLAPLASSLIPDRVLLRLASKVIREVVPEAIKTVSAWLKSQGLFSLSKQLIYSLYSGNFKWLEQGITQALMNHDFSRVIDSIADEAKAICQELYPDSQHLTVPIIDHISAQMKLSPNLAGQTMLWQNPDYPRLLLSEFFRSHPEALSTTSPTVGSIMGLSQAMMGTLSSLIPQTTESKQAITQILLAFGKKQASSLIPGLLR